MAPARRVWRIRGLLDRAPRALPSCCASICRPRGSRGSLCAERSHWPCSGRGDRDSFQSGTGAPSSVWRGRPGASSPGRFRLTRSRCWSPDPTAILREPRHPLCASSARSRCRPRQARSPASKFCGARGRARVADRRAPPFAKARVCGADGHDDDRCERRERPGGGEERVSCRRGRRALRSCSHGYSRRLR